MVRWSQRLLFVKLEVQNKFVSGINLRSHCLHLQTSSFPFSEKFNFLIFKIVSFLSNFLGKMVSSWCQRVFCRARRDLPKSLWAWPRQTLSSSS